MGGEWRGIGGMGGNGGGEWGRNGGEDKALDDLKIGQPSSEPHFMLTPELNNLKLLPSWQCVHDSWVL